MTAKSTEMIKTSLCFFFGKNILPLPAIKDIAAIKTLLKENDYSDLKGCIIIGDQDPFYKNSLELHKLLEANHIDCKLTVKRLGHFFPENFPELLSDGVRYP